MPLVTEEKIGTAAAARLLGVSENRVRDLARAGALPYEQTGIGRVYRLGDVARLVSEREAAQREKRR